MRAYFIRRLSDGRIEPNHEKKQGIWATRATALARIKSHWHIKWDWNMAYVSKRPWAMLHTEHKQANDEWRAHNPFDQWWPKHYEIIELTEVKERKR